MKCVDLPNLGKTPVNGAVELFFVVFSVSFLGGFWEGFGSHFGVQNRSTIHQNFDRFFNRFLDGFGMHFGTFFESILIAPTLNPTRSQRCFLGVRRFRLRIVFRSHFDAIFVQKGF